MNQGIQGTHRPTLSLRMGTPQREAKREDDDVLAIQRFRKRYGNFGSLFG